MGKETGVQWSLWVLCCMVVELAAACPHIISVDPWLIFDKSYHCTGLEALQPFDTLKKTLEYLGYHLVPWEEIEKYPIHDVAAVVFFDLRPSLPGNFFTTLQKYPVAQRILYLWETSMHDSNGNNPAYQKLFGKVFSLWSRYVDNVRVFQNFYVQPSLEMIPHRIDFDQKKLCTMIVGCKMGGTGDSTGSLYGERLHAIEFFERFSDEVFAFYGKGWSPRKSYKGPVESKKEYLKRYKFCICYENAHIYNGYITEKIFDCFVAGCIPVYWGAPDITDYIPANCFIDKRMFSTLDSLYHFMNNMDRQTYQTYLDNICAFLASPAAHRYTIDYFVDRFVEVLDATIKETGQGK
jgi:alpha(1,3/1,4) fucosyltransferase